MLYVRNGDITISRGDSAILDVKLKDIRGVPYEMQQGDTLTFKVSDGVDGGGALYISKSFATNEVILLPADTQAIPNGDYYFALRLETRQGNEYTLLGVQADKTKHFHVLPEVG